MILQLLTDGLLTGAVIALGAIGITLCLAILRFANFGYAELLTVGGYAALAAVLAYGGTGAPLGPFSFGGFLGVALAVGLAVTAVVALVSDIVVFRPLRRRGAGPLVLIFASFGLALVLRHIVLLMFGTQPEYYSREIQIAVLLPGDVRVMPDQILVLAVTVLALVALWWLLNRTRVGLAMRAVAENTALAQACAIDPEAAVRWTWIVSGMLGALAGTLFGLTVQLRPEMGANLLLPLFTAAVLGGVGSIPGAVIGGLLVGVAENLSVLVLPTSYKATVPFLIMLACFLLRPKGLFGK
ncbi:branched-chain amino acid ABC transporter permease [Reyranella sp. CPCC 100927]|uniref:branched-chain amino acid ABC transporter permease n=1 Tax=Reyranella sp. CPCC 100927 TaxID=2599616 RepID=UPI0011B44914|nr:branched-chain amino acid ABC transporter permease [Reyranella sp. CPCC 100927]TWT15238.1 branched-chain amino acid ABC transporter permease [Reyranella sp. CPCC 100927]